MVFALPASADIVTVTVTGTVAPYTFDNPRGWGSNPLIDTAGIFGTPGDNLFGHPFSVIWTVNTHCSSCAHVSGSTPPGTQLGDLPVSPIQSAVLTINGSSVTYGSGEYGIMFVSGGNFYVNVTR